MWRTGGFRGGGRRWRLGATEAADGEGAGLSLRHARAFKWYLDLAYSNSMWRQSSMPTSILMLLLISGAFCTLRTCSGGETTWRAASGERGAWRAGQGPGRAPNKEAARKEAAR